MYKKGLIKSEEKKYTIVYHKYIFKNTCINDSPTERIWEFIRMHPSS